MRKVTKKSTMVKKKGTKLANTRKTPSNSKRGEYRTPEDDYRIIAFILQYGTTEILENQQNSGIGKPFNITQLTKDFNSVNQTKQITQPLLYRFCNELKDAGNLYEVPPEFMVENFPKYAKSSGPEKKFFIPTIDCLYFACFNAWFREIQRQKKELGLSEEELFFDESKIEPLQWFDRVLGYWWSYEYFIDTICHRNNIWKDSVFPEYVSEEIVVNDPDQAKTILYDSVEYISKIRHAYFKIRKELPLIYQNMIGETELATKYPEFINKSKIKLYQKFTPYTMNLDFAHNQSMKIYDSLHSKIQGQRMSTEELKNLRSGLDSQIAERERETSD